MALEGTIREFGLADIFQLIGLQKKTGTLFLKGPDSTVNISFEDGMVVKTEDSQLNSKYQIGKILINRGYITPEQLNEALEIQKSTAQKICFVLTSQELVNRDIVAEALAFQMTETIYKVFRWRGGDYKFYQDKVDYERELIRPLSSEHVLMDGIRILDEWPMIEKKMPPPELVLKRSDKLESGLEEDEGQSTDIFSSEDEPRSQRPSKEGMDILGLVDGKRSVVEIMERSPLGNFETSKALVELIAKGFIVKTDTKPLVHIEEAPIKAVAAPRTEPRLNMLPYAFLAVAAILILLQVTGTRKIMSARTEGLLALKAPFAVNQLEKVYENTLLYFMDYGKYPESSRELEEMDYISDSDARDPWGNQFVIYVEQSGQIVVSSAGPDRVQNTADDITSLP